MPRLAVGFHRSRDLLSHGMFKLSRRFERQRLPAALQPFADHGLDPLIVRLHDEVGQWLALAMLQIDGLRAAEPTIHEGLGPLRSSLERAALAVREITRGHTAMSSAESLHTAIEQAVANGPWADYPLQCVLGPELYEMAATAVPLAVRVICELVGNAHRHAHATYVRLCVGYRHGVLHIEVEDDGIGMACANDRQHFGLRSLLYQVTRAGGRLHLHAKPGIGTRVAVDIPLRKVRRTPSATLLRDRS